VQNWETGKAKFFFTQSRKVAKKDKNEFRFSFGPFIWSCRPDPASMSLTRLDFSFRRNDKLLLGYRIERCMFELFFAALRLGARRIALPFLLWPRLLL
jgi:hypothetical protein